jgi:addiction module HigA family antidote
MIKPQKGAKFTKTKNDIQQNQVLANKENPERDFLREHQIMKRKKLDPVHPGEILQEEFLKPMGLSQNRLALALRVPARRINEIVLGRRRVTADTALRLSRYFGMSSQFWLGLQMDYELDVAADKIESQIEKDITPMSASG